MFENVIVGVDERPTGSDAIELARHLVSPQGKLMLVNVHSGELSLVHAVHPELLAGEREASHELLVRERENANFDAEPELVSFVALSPGRGLHDLAEERGADLLVVGSSSRRVLGRAMLGDDTRAGVERAPCAVAIATRGYAEHPMRWRASGWVMTARPRARRRWRRHPPMAARRHASWALEVISVPTYSFTGLTSRRSGDDDRSAGHQEAKERHADARGVEGRAVYGLPGEELAAFSADVDLLVVGSRNYGPLHRLVVGSTSDYLERHARCSLLVLPRVAGAQKADR